MTPILIYLISGAAGGLVALVTTYFTSYISEKGKGRATKEDIDAITRKVEDIRLINGAVLEEVKARHQLRLAAVDKRLSVHQEAFSHWHSLYMAQMDGFDNVINAASEWWNHNCVYLEPAVRDGFLDVMNRERLFRQRKVIGEIDMDTINRHHADMYVFPALLFDAMQIPRFNEVARETLKRDIDARSFGEGGPRGGL